MVLRCGWEKNVHGICFKQGFLRTSRSKEASGSQNELGLKKIIILPRIFKNIPLWWFFSQESRITPHKPHSSLQIIYRNAKLRKSDEVLTVKSVGSFSLRNMLHDYVYISVFIAKAFEMSINHTNSIQIKLVVGPRAVGQRILVCMTNVATINNYRSQNFFSNFQFRCDKRFFIVV